MEEFSLTALKEIGSGREVRKGTGKDAPEVLFPYSVGLEPKDGHIYPSVRDFSTPRRLEVSGTEMKEATLPASAPYVEATDGLKIPPAGASGRSERRITNTPASNCTDLQFG